MMDYAYPTHVTLPAPITRWLHADADPDNTRQLIITLAPDAAIVSLWHDTTEPRKGHVHSACKCDTEAPDLQTALHRLAALVLCTCTATRMCRVCHKRMLLERQGFAPAQLLRALEQAGLTSPQRESVR